MFQIFKTVFNYSNGSIDFNHLEHLEQLERLERASGAEGFLERG